MFLWKDLWLYIHHINILQFCRVTLSHWLQFSNIYCIYCNLCVSFYKVEDFLSHQLRKKRIVLPCWIITTERFEFIFLFVISGKQMNFSVTRENTFPDSSINYQAWWQSRWLGIATRKHQGTQYRFFDTFCFTPFPSCNGNFFFFLKEDRSYQMGN